MAAASYTLQSRDPGGDLAPLHPVHGDGFRPGCMTREDRYLRPLHAQDLRDQADVFLIRLSLHGGRRDPELQGVVPEARRFRPGGPRNDPDAEDDAGFSFTNGNHGRIGHRKEAESCIRLGTRKL